MDGTGEGAAAVESDVAEDDKPVRLHPIMVSQSVVDVFVVCCVNNTLAA